VKTVIEVIEGYIAIVHDVLGTREAFENHPGEVTDEERSEILDRLQAAWFPDPAPVTGDLNNPNQPVDAAFDITDDHAKFLQSRGYAPADAAEAKAFIDGFTKKERRGFFVEFASWLKAQAPAK